MEWTLTSGIKAPVGFITSAICRLVSRGLRRAVRKVNGSANPLPSFTGRVGEILRRLGWALPGTVARSRRQPGKVGGLLRLKMRHRSIRSPCLGCAHAIAAVGFARPASEAFQATGTEAMT